MTGSRARRLLIGGAIAIVVILLLGRPLTVFYTDILWYDALGQSGVFWQRFNASLITRLVTGVLGGAVIMLNLWYVLRQLGPVHLRRRYGNLEIAEQVPRSYLVTGAIAVAVLAGWWLSGIQFGGTVPVSVLAWLRHESWGLTDPLFGKDLSFYIFSLPIYVRMIDFITIVLVWSALLVAVGYVMVGAIRVSGTLWQIDERPRVHFAALAAAVLVFVAIRYFLGRYLLLIDGGGFAGTIGYTDVHARLPARLVLSVLAVVAAGAIIYSAVRRTVLPAAVALGLLLVAGVGMGAVYPAIMQQLQVEPNQLSREVEYIRWHLEYTRRAYGLDAIDRRDFAYRDADNEDWAEMQPVLDQLPLWDPEPLQTAFTEIQAEYRYYQFADVDYDRYGPPGDQRQVAVGVREFNQEGLNEDARTWQTIHLNPLFTRGMGMVATPTAARQRGEPDYWLGGVLPVQLHPAASPELALTEPSVYFGETMADYAVIGHTGMSMQAVAEQPGSMQPVPDVTTSIPLDSFLRILSFAWRFGDQNLIFARELGDNSRMIFRRTVTERVRALAPWLLWDSDPHPAVVEGRIVWLIDGYSVSSNYPLSRPFTIQNVGQLSYMQSAVKATVDGVTGEVRMYALPDADPIVRTYRSVFPDLLLDWSAMPPAIEAHLRYPPLLFRLQADVLEEYHLIRPELFYAGEDIWQLPDEISPSQRLRYRPGFAMARVPGSDEVEFLLINAFNARQRQNMTSLLIARSDAPHYGELVLLEMPRGDQVKGPAQVQALIEQDPIISQQLSLWRQQGTGVEMGRLRIVPTESSILYVEPIYLAASERAIPQLQRVVVSDGINVMMGESLDAAVAALTGDEAAPPPRAESDPAPSAAGVPAAVMALPQRALDLMRQADAYLRAGDFANFGRTWSELRALLEQGSDGVPPR